MLDEILSNKDMRPRDLEEEVLDVLLDEIEYIYDPGIRSFVKAILMAAPEWFWTAPSSLEPEVFDDELEEGGLILFLKRALRIFDILGLSANLSIEELDYGRAALLVGQMDRFSVENDKLEYNYWAPYSTPMKIDKIVEINEVWAVDGSSNTVEIGKEGIENVKRLVRVQDGKWSTVPEVRPKTTLELICHQALYLASGLRMIIDDSI